MFVVPPAREKSVICSRNLCAMNCSVAGLNVPVVSVVTQTVVRADDPAMRHPTKPIGPFYSREQAEERQRHFAWQIVEDAARGYRRVVPFSGARRDR